MAIAEARTSGEFEIGRVISRAFSLIGQNFVTFFILDLVAVLPLAAQRWYLSTIIAPGSAQQLALARAPSLALFAAGTGLLYAVLAIVVQAGITRASVVSLNGQRTSIGACLATGLSVLFPALGIYILVLLGVMLGFILLIIPGFMLAVRWSIVLPVRVMEGPGILKSIGRSAELTSGYRWPILGCFLIMILISVGVSLVQLPLTLAVTPAFGGTATGPLLYAQLAISILVQAVSLMLGATFAASIYYELRTIKDGVGADQLASVFS